MYQRGPWPYEGHTGCGVFIEMKYFEEDIIGENVDRYLIYETLDQSAVAIDTGIVTVRNTNREIALHKGLLLQDVQNSRGHASWYLQRSHHQGSKFRWCWEIYQG
jgi:hypothetical protein